jgi:hypothetical protein
MKKILVSFFFFVLSASLLAQVVNTAITFRVNMSVQIKKGLFSFASDTVVVRGSFNGWSGSTWKLTKNPDSIYTGTYSINDSTGKTYEFKFVKLPDGWEGSPNRTFVKTGTAMTLPIYWFNNDSIYIFKPTVANTIKFTADLSKIWGTGTGFFDPNADSLLLMGLDWDGLGTIVSGNRKMTFQALTPKIYTTTMRVRGFLGDSTKFKYKAYPNTHFTNDGWEMRPDRWFKYVSDTVTTVNLSPVYPDIYPTKGPLVNNVLVTFRVDMTKNPKNKYNNLPINNTTIQWIGIKGGSPPLGSWGGSWVRADSGVTFQVMNDAGLRGDLVAGDKIWSDTVNFWPGVLSGAVEFKFGCAYPGADTVNGGTSPLDNEAGFGLNHIFSLLPPGPITLFHVFGDMVSSVISENPNLPNEFTLSQNYPNPFNPTTKISFSISKDANVSLKVYNIMGEEVATLLRGFQKAGGYDVTFDASSFASGMYIYKLESENFTATKKMILMK